MPSNAVTCHFKILTRHNPEDENEIRRYSCSECDDEIFNINVHAQSDHDTLMFDVDGEEEVKRHAPPVSICGIMGCNFEAHGDDKLHSWENNGQGKY